MVLFLKKWIIGGSSIFLNTGKFVKISYSFSSLKIKGLQINFSATFFEFSYHLLQNIENSWIEIEVKLKLHVLQQYVLVFDLNYRFQSILEKFLQSNEQTGQK